MSHVAPASRHLPVPPVHRWTRPLAHFLHVESASGIVLLVCTVAALVLANSPAADAFHKFWHTKVGIEIGGFRVGGELGHFLINDVLMTIFFFVVGLEIKREMVAGELRDARKAALPVAAALGGMLVPAGLYFALQAGQPGEGGWGIPMATDIAFVVGVMALLGKRVPFGLKIVLLSLAIADDIGAVVVIAFFYNSGLDFAMLGLAVGGFGFTYLLNRIGVRSVPVYGVVGMVIWLAMYKSGVHPTIAGVVLGFLTPTRVWIADQTLVAVLRDGLDHAPGDGPERRETLKTVEFTAREGISPLERLEVRLHPWVGFVIMPLFALANAGVHIDAGELTNPVALAVALGLLVGKPLGILLFAYIAVRLGVAALPQGVNWWVLLGGGCLAGIGFTMSLFVAGLAFGESADLLAAGKLGTLAGSACSAVLGPVVLLVVLKSGRKEE
jgi:NhaA family Na+:H+ antiporter